MKRFLILAFLSATAAGCASTGPERTGKLLDEIEAFRVDLAEFKGQVDAVVEALNQVVAQASLGPKEAYAGFADALEETDSRTAGLFDDAEALRLRTEQYFADWEVEAATIQNPDIRKRSDDRRVRQIESARKVDVAVETARDTISPFLSDLRDLRTLLMNDLTPQGITGSRDLVENVGKGAVKVKDRVDSVAREALRVSGELRVAAGGTPNQPIK